MFHFQESLKNINWRNYMVIFGLGAFAFLLIFGNFKSPSYYAKLKAAKKEMQQNVSDDRSIQLFSQTFTEIPDNNITKNCTVTWSENMNFLNYYLRLQLNCSFIKLRISDTILPENEFRSNWLEGNFNFSSIEISRSKLNGIQNGAFDQQSVAYLTELELSDAELPKLTEDTFKGLKAIETFTLVNRIEEFSGEAFLKPMMKTLKKLVMTHVTNTPTDPGPWLRGDSFPNLVTIIFDGSNFGGYIKAATFEHLKSLATLTMKSCKITSIADGSFDFMMVQQEFFISLQENQLRQLDGEYLSSISSSRRLDIQTNPLDCTCELEHLARVFKEYPQAFGEDVKCSTPPHLAEKSLNDIDINTCDDEPSPTLNSTALLETTTIKNVYTTPSTPKTPTAPSTEPIFITCARHDFRFINSPSNFVEISPPDGYFKIITINESSIRLTFEGPIDDLAVIWFYEQPNSEETDANFRTFGEPNAGCQSELDTSLLVEGLLVNQSYTFCLVKNGTKVISPFNCKSHFSNFGSVAKIWLSKNDRPLVIGIFVLSILVSVFVGLVGMFLFIRYYPCMLRSSKQVEIDNKNIGEEQKNIKNSNTEYSFGNSFNSEPSTTNFRRFSTESGLSYMMANNYEELEFCRKMNATYDFLFANRVPKSPAPPLPARINSFGNQKVETLIKKDFHVMEEKFNDDGYTSVI